MKYILTLEGSAAALAAILQFADEQYQRNPSIAFKPVTVETTPPPADGGVVDMTEPAPMGETAPSAGPADAAAPVAAPQAISASEPEVDADGVVYDERIHSSGANRLNKDGTWRKRRGVTTQEFNQVLAEISNTDTPPAIPAPMPMQTPQIAPDAPPAPAPAPQIEQPPVATSPAAVAEGAVPVPAQPVPTAPPMSVAPPASEPTPTGEVDFMTFMTQISQKMMPGVDGVSVVNTDYLAGLSQELGLNAVTELNARPDLIGVAVALMQRDGKW